MLRFKKYEGLGNDFIIPETICISETPVRNPLTALTESDRLRWSTLCDRRLSIGADGVLLHYQTPEQNHFMTIINQDGSLAEMCGNGLRCMALHIANQSNLDLESVDIQTLAGSMQAQVHPLGVRCHIGPADVKGIKSIRVGDSDFHGYFVSTGNPHVIILDPVMEITRRECAELLSRHPVFEEGANISFATATSGTIDLKVFERGCGWTQACGTAAVATTAAYWFKHDCQGLDMSVRLPGGTLNIGGAFENMVMDGPAKLTFTGSANVDWKEI